MKVNPNSSIVAWGGRWAEALQRGEGHQPGARLPSTWSRPQLIPGAGVEAAASFPGHLKVRWTLPRSLGGSQDWHRTLVYKTEDDCSAGRRRGDGQLQRKGPRPQRLSGQSGQASRGPGMSHGQRQPRSCSRGPPGVTKFLPSFRVKKLQDTSWEWVTLIKGTSWDSWQQRGWGRRSCMEEAGLGIRGWHS